MWNQPIWWRFLLALRFSGKSIKPILISQRVPQKFFSSFPFFWVSVSVGLPQQFASMDDSHSAHNPLLSSHGVENGCAKNTSTFASASKLTLKLLIWVVFIAWVALIILLPAESVNELVGTWVRLTGGSAFGIKGSWLCLFISSSLVSSWWFILLLKTEAKKYTWCRKPLCAVYRSSFHHYIPRHCLPNCLWRGQTSRVCDFTETLFLDVHRN